MGKGMYIWDNLMQRCQNVVEQLHGLKVRKKVYSWDLYRVSWTIQKRELVKGCYYFSGQHTGTIGDMIIRVLDEFTKSPRTWWKSGEVIYSARRTRRGAWQWSLVGEYCLTADKTELGMDHGGKGRRIRSSRSFLGIQWVQGQDCIRTCLRKKQREKDRHKGTRKTT